MSLTKKDIQIIKDLLSQQEDRLTTNVTANVTTNVITKLTAQIEQVRIESRQSFESLKIYIDTELKKIDARFNQIDHRFDVLIRDINRVLINHESRISRLEEQT